VSAAEVEYTDTSEADMYVRWSVMWSKPHSGCLLWTSLSCLFCQYEAEFFTCTSSNIAIITEL